MNLNNASLLDAALYYAEQGIKVFPLAHKNAPVPSNGFHDGTTNAGIITDWWSREQWLIGGVIPANIVIVDTDVADAELAMKAFGWELPATLTAKSRRGSHRWYRTPTSISRKINVMHGVDVLTNGYVILPPSKHTEGNYKWVGEFDKDAISDAPEWLLAHEKAEAMEEEGLDGDRLLKGIPEGFRQTTLFRKACQYRGQGKISKAEAVVLIDAMAKASGFKEQTADYIVNRVWKNYPANESDEPAKRGKVWNLAVLAKSNIERPVDLIEGLIPQGVSLLTSDPKAGKSFMAAQMACAIAKGSKLWGRQARENGVFYIDAEQGEGFAVDRWMNQTGGQIPTNVDVAFSWRRMDKGGVKDLEEYLAVSPHVRLLVIDTLSQFYPVEQQSGGNAYFNEAVIMEKIRKIYRDWGCSVLMIHHNSKATQGSKLKSASSTQALTGGCDGVMTLADSNLPELKFDGNLYVTGKNIHSSIIRLHFDEETSLWQER